MSIISDALKKADKSRKGGSFKTGIYTAGTRKSKRFSWYRLGLNVMLGVVMVGVGGSAFYVYEMRDQFAPEWTLPKISLGNESSTEGVRGIGRFAVEEKLLHNVGELSAQPGDPLFILSGIARNEDGFLAVINDQILRTGDRIEGAQIMNITLDYVELELNESRIFLEKGY